MNKTINWILAIDIGSKKTGIAVGQTLTCKAQPITVLKIKINELGVKHIKPYVDEWRIDTVVFGCPMHGDGTAHPLRDTITALGNRISKDLKVKVSFIDEYLSSHEARSRDRNSKYIDALAAVIIAEDWMAQNIA